MTAPADEARRRIMLDPRPLRIPAYRRMCPSTVAAWTVVELSASAAGSSLASTRRG